MKTRAIFERCIDVILLELKSNVLFKYLDGLYTNLWKSLSKNKNKKIRDRYDKSRNVLREGYEEKDLKMSEDDFFRKNAENEEDY